MKIIRFSEYGGPDVLKLGETDLPRPKAGEVLLKIEAIGVNYTDIAHRRQTTREPVPLPYTPGIEVVGTVIEATEGVTHLPIGTQVIALVPHGGYAEYLTVPAAQVISEKLTAHCHTVTGYYAGYIGTRPDLIISALYKLFQYTLSGRITPQVKQRFPLEKAAEAHRQMETRQTIGKIILLP